MITCSMISTHIGGGSPINPGEGGPLWTDKIYTCPEVARSPPWEVWEIQAYIYAKTLAYIM